MRGFLGAVLMTALVIAGLMAFMWGFSKEAARNTSGTDASPLVLYCAAGMQAPVSQIAAAYEREFGRRIDIQYGGSGSLLSQVQVARQGDLFLAGDDSYLDTAAAKGLVAERMLAVRLTPVLLVAKGNPKGVTGLADLTREGVRVALGAPEAASIGQTTKRLCEAAGLWEQIKAAVETRGGVFKPTVNEVGTDVKLGSVDAGIVWDSVAHLFPELEAVPLAGAESVAANASVGILTFSNQPTEALRFARYLTARDKGLTHFAQAGYQVAEGDQWAETPEVTYFSGGVNRLAIEKTLAAFEAREGCRISTVYNGCGILVSQMKLGERPDAYHSCDISFMNGIEELFEPCVNISETTIVIATAKGNPHGLKTLGDLAKPGLKLGVTNEEQSALGALTARLLRGAGLYEGVMKNVVSQTPTADLLVNQLRTGSLDAVIVYEVNTVKSREVLEVIPLEIPGAVATQTYAIGAKSAHKQLAGRLLDWLKSAESQAVYRDSGFRWVAQ